MNPLSPGYARGSWRAGLPTVQTPRLGRRNRARTFLFADNAGNIIYGVDGRNWKVQATGHSDITIIATFQQSVVCVNTSLFTQRGTKNLRVAGGWADLAANFNSLLIASFEGGYVDGYDTPVRLVDQNFQPLTPTNNLIGNGAAATGRIQTYVGRLRGRGLFQDGGLAIGASQFYGYHIGGYSMSLDYGLKSGLSSAPFIEGYGDLPVLNGMHVKIGATDVLTVGTADPDFRFLYQQTTTALTPAFNVSAPNYITAAKGVLLVRTTSQNGYALTRNCLNWQLVDTNVQTGKIPGPVLLHNGECFAAVDSTGAGMLTSFDGLAWGYTPVAGMGLPKTGICSDYLIP